MRGRLVMSMAAGVVIAGALVACGDDPTVTQRGKAAFQAPAAVPRSAAPAAATEDENATLAARVIAALRRDPVVGRLGIDAVSAEGAVTLFGTAPTPGDREKAGQVAAGVEGVRSVLNNLVIVAGS